MTTTCRFGYKIPWTRDWGSLQPPTFQRAITCSSIQVSSSQVLRPKDVKRPTHKTTLWEVSCTTLNGVIKVTVLTPRQTAEDWVGSLITPRRRPICRLEYLNTRVSPTFCSLPQQTSFQVKSCSMTMETDGQAQ